MPDDPGFYISLLVSFMSGGLVGALITHWLALGRDRENRQAQREKEREDRLREFRRSMREWEIQIEKCENSEHLFSYLRDNFFSMGKSSRLQKIFAIGISLRNCVRPSAFEQGSRRGV